MCNLQTPPLESNYNKEGTGTYFQLGVKYFVPTLILLSRSQEEFAKYVDYLFNFLPFSLKLIINRRFSKSLVIPCMHTGNQKLEKIWETPLRFRSSKKPNAP